MSENNTNNKPTYIFQQKVEFIDNTTYNPFAPNQNKNINQTNNQKNYQKKIYILFVMLNQSIMF